MSREPLVLHLPLAEQVAQHLRNSGHPQAQSEVDPSQRGAVVAVSPNRYIIFDPIDRAADGQAIVEKVIANAKKTGDLDAVRWLDERGVVDLPQPKDATGKSGE